MFAFRKIHQPLFTLQGTSPTLLALSVRLVQRLYELLHGLLVERRARLQFGAGGRAHRQVFESQRLTVAVGAAELGEEASQGYAGDVGRGGGSGGTLESSIRSGHQCNSMQQCQTISSKRHA